MGDGTSDIGGVGMIEEVKHRKGKDRYTATITSFITSL